MRLKPQNILIITVCVSSILSMLNFALWPVFLIELRNHRHITNTDFGWISGDNILGYVTSTPVHIGITD